MSPTAARVVTGRFGGAGLSVTWNLPAFDLTNLVRMAVAFVIGYCVGWLLLAELAATVQLLKALAQWPR